MKYPFEAPFDEIQLDPDQYVDSIYSSLQSQFLVMPKGEGFIEYPIFENGYESLKRVTGGFVNFSENDIYNAIINLPISFVVLRSILGFTPPEWAYLTALQTGIKIDQTFARNLDRKIRMKPMDPLSDGKLRRERLNAMVFTACQILREGAPFVGEKNLHRMNKADTSNGPSGIQLLADLDVPYAMLLYERFLGRPFASHRDSVSELVGDTLEYAIEDVLTKARISFRKTKRAERIPGFDQAPDFIIPSEFNPQIVIEAKITEDDGTARDKVTRIQHLAEISQNGKQFSYELIACIDGRGFGVRYEDMKKILLATRGKVFTFKTLDRLVECTRLREFKIR